MNKHYSWLSELSRKARFGFVTSVTWIIIIFITAIKRAEGYRSFDLVDFLVIFLLWGIFPLFLSWSFRWIRRSG
jgi:hypothetical protein